MRCGSARCTCFPTASTRWSAIDVQPNVSPEETLARRAHRAGAAGAAAALAGVLVLTDIFGATPCNVAQKLVDGVHSRLITGVNLPMLLRAVSYRHEPLEALVSRAVIGGTAGRDAGGGHRTAEPGQKKA